MILHGGKIRGGAALSYGVLPCFGGNSFATWGEDPIALAIFFYLKLRWYER